MFGWVLDMSLGILWFLNKGDQNGWTNISLENYLEKLSSCVSSDLLE